MTPQTIDIFLIQFQWYCRKAQVSMAECTPTSRGALQAITSGISYQKYSDLLL